MNDVRVRENGQGGIAIVGQGSPPTFRTVCMQNTQALANFRFGVLLFDVAKTLLFNVRAGFTFSQPADGRFGDGIAVSASHELFFWNVFVSLNNRAGLSAFGPDPSEMTHVHLVGGLLAAGNPINLVEEGDAILHPHDGPTAISGLCGFTSPITAPPVNANCGNENCHVASPGIEPSAPPVP